MSLLESAQPQQAAAVSQSSLERDRINEAVDSVPPPNRFLRRLAASNETAPKWSINFFHNRETPKFDIIPVLDTGGLQGYSNSTKKIGRQISD